MSAYNVPGVVLSAVRGLAHLICTRNLYRRDHYYPHPTDKKTEEQSSRQFSEFELSQSDFGT